MIRMDIHLTGSAAVLLKPNKREMAKCMREMWRELGIYWHRKMRPKHFTNPGAREYGYTPRQGERGRPHPKGKFYRTYTGRKLRQRGHTRPLVLTGESRALTRMRIVRADSKGVRIPIKANKLNYRYRGSPIHMRDEMTRISMRERQQLIRRGERYLAAAVMRSKARVSKRVA